ncbi:MAG: C4-type zinc ribbon domain-containing protein [Christensenellaceae bacterium]|jgi:predicted  nucleic acid-binding Zn-ribbon protein|nr:C4-type zinc ribbon domain-containing protein [Christensenellaceae bacterium]
MQQLERLWAYQKEDIKVTRYEGEMRAYPMRTKLLRLRNLVADQQTLVKGMEKDAGSALEKLEEMQKAHEELLRQVEEIAGKLEDDSAFPTAVQAHKVIVQLQEAETKLRGFEKELARMARDSQHIGARYREIRQKAMKAREEYTKLKAQYDLELAKQNERLAALKEEREKAAEGIDSALIDRYMAIKEQSFPPMATPNGDQCSGCNMSLPAVVMQSIRSGEGITECENCGRILIPPQE